MLECQEKCDHGCVCFRGSGVPLEMVDFLHINIMAKIFPVIKAKATDKGSRRESSYEILRRKSAELSHLFCYL